MKNNASFIDKYFNLCKIKTMWQRNVKSNECDKYNFTNLEELSSFLLNLFHRIDQQQEYNIFIHQINDYYDNFNNLHGTDMIKYKMKRIIDEGFKIGDYSTLSGTTKLIGTTRNLDINNVVDYDYYRRTECKALCVVAIPKNVKVQGETLEYSSFNGVDSWSFPEELTQEYESHGIKKPELHHYKCSLFDAIKKYNDLPNCYLLGLVRIEPKNSKFRFYNTKTHLAFKSEEEQSYHDKLVEDHIVELYEKYNTRDIKSLIVHAYKDFQDYYDYLSDFDI